MIEAAYVQPAPVIEKPIAIMTTEECNIEIEALIKGILFHKASQAELERQQRIESLLF